jgi:CHASE2 domain-containing sensor protein/predicted Ser/Thr protein kinase
MPLTEFQATRRQILIGVVVGLACWAILGGAYLGGVFEAFDLRMLDWRFHIRGERDASGIVAMVPIDDATIRAYGRWPIPRDQYALLLTALAESGAKAIGIDLQLPEDLNHDPTQNALLAYVSGQHPNIVHAVSFLADTATAHGSQPAPGPGLEALLRQGTANADVEVPVAAGVSLPYDELLEEASALGHITVITDRDGAVRRQPLLIRYGDRIYPALGMRMVGVGSNRAGPPRVWRAAGGVSAGWPSGPEWRIPLDRQGATPLDFAGDRAAFSDGISMIDALRAYQAGDSARLRQAIAGRYALIGLDSRTEVSEDVGSTPFAATTPLLFIHANAVENLVRHRFLTRAPAAVYLVVLALVSAALGWIFSILPLAASASVAGGAVLATAIADFGLFSLWSVDAPPLAALLLSPAIYASVASARFLFLESRSKEREEDIREGRSVEQQFLPEALIGHDLSRYRVLEQLGRGAMGVVYRASDPRLERDVAIKVLPGRALADEKVRRRFRREALALSKLNHPHIAGIMDFDSQDGTDFLVMELVRGTPLTGRIRHGALAESEVVRLTCEVAEALVEAHARGVIHRDLKPENIMLTGEGKVKVLDFGVAMFLDETTTVATKSQLTEAGHMVGTLPYMAPEVLKGERVDGRSDLYSLGVIAFQMATGRRPFPDDEFREMYFTILNQEPPPPRILNGRISTELEAVILRLLAKKPANRFASAAELLQTLRGQAGAAGEKAAPPGEGPAITTEESALTGELEAPTREREAPTRDNVTETG